MTADVTADVAARLAAAGCVRAADEARLLVAAAGSAAGLAALVDRRVAGEPLEHVLGWAELAGARVALGPGVFVPRPRTALLVRAARDRAPVGGGVVVDLCCGSGAVGLAVVDGRPQLALHAVDVDPAAVICARGNLAGRGAVHTGDLDAPLPPDLRGRVDVLVANVPYVPTSQIRLLPAEARLHEPPVALDGGADGLDLVRRVAALAPRWLAPAGSALVETSAAQADAAAAAFAAAGLAPGVLHDARLEATVVAAAARRG